MMAEAAFCLQTLFVIGFPIMVEGFVLSETCRWNYSLRNKHGEDEYKVEYRNLGQDCKWLYKQVSSDKMSRGLPYFMDTVVERTGDPALQRINISWYLERKIQEYLLTIKLLRLENDFILNPEDTICIYIWVKQAQTQIQQNYRIVFDCIQVRTGTIGAALEMVLRKRSISRQECYMDRYIDRPCFRSRPEMYISNINAHCCPKEIPQLRVVQEDFCTWVFSVRSLGLSSATYILNASNGTLVDMGNMLASKATDLFARRITVDTSDIFTIWISFWCSFDPNNNQEDHVCLTVDENLNATMCNKFLASVTTPTTREIISPKVVTVITLGCVAVVFIATVFVFFWARDHLPCCRVATEGPQNNDRMSNVAVKTNQNETDKFLADNTTKEDAVLDDPAQNVNDITETTVVQCASVTNETNTTVLYWMHQGECEPRQTGLCER